jgi:hypothetical protein
MRISTKLPIERRPQPKARPGIRVVEVTAGSRHPLDGQAKGEPSRLVSLPAEPWLLPAQRAQEGA